MTPDTTRKEFEEWYIQKYNCNQPLSRSPNGDYLFSHPSVAYEAYLEGQKKSEDTKLLERAFSLGMKIQTSFAMWSLVESESEFRATIATNQPKDKQ